MSTFSLRRAKQRRKQQQEEVVVEVKEEVVVEEKIEEEVVEGVVFVCPHCSKEYKTERGLKKHIETKHKDGE